MKFEEKSQSSSSLELPWYKDNVPINSESILSILDIGEATFNYIF